MRRYNGILLPALPPDRNKNIYRYGIIQHGGVLGMEHYSFIAATASGVMDDSYTVGEHTVCAWVVAANEQSAKNMSGAFPGISTDAWLKYEDAKVVTEYSYTDIVWSDFDILNTDGTVYLKASKPFDLDAFKIGLSLGLCGKALPWKAEPVAWWYGHVAKEGETPTHTIDGVGYVGAELLDIRTVWDDRIDMPHGVIALGGNGRYFLYISKRPLSHVGSQVTTTSLTLYTEYWHFETQTAAKHWDKTHTGMATLEINASDCIWTSHDILNEDGTVFLAATAPIPVYE